MTRESFWADQFAYVAALPTNLYRTPHEQVCACAKWADLALAAFDRRFTEK